ncbi:Heptaprenyl diphosphate synthase component 2 [Phycisphaerae bacterium RAS1]|nr:Heptaprenyl diphosphate synthase component 2 [Phycisphaerae bacterium RAS1]
MAGTPDAPTLDLGMLYAPIAADLDAARRVFRDELISDQGFISDLCAHVAHFQGKSLRPALLLLAGRACGEVRPAHHVLAAVVEMVHLATLVHDDVLDDADIRRRAATVNRLWGNERAVLMGDFLISHAFHLCSSLDSQHASRLIGRTTNTVCEGEMMQVANRGNVELTQREYIDIISRKTASLIAASCELGAHFADAPPPTVARLRRFGLSIGIAFQIIDDVLDLTGDEIEAGKSLGRDVEKGKLTLPLIHFLGGASQAEKADMLALLGSDDARRHRQIAARLQAAGSMQFAIDAAAEYIRTAQAALAALPAGAARDSLCVMADFVINRRR